MRLFRETHPRRGPVLVETVRRNQWREYGEHDEHERDGHTDDEQPAGRAAGMPEPSQHAASAHRDSWLSQRFHQNLTRGSTHAVAKSIKRLTPTTIRAMKVTIPCTAR